MSRNDKELASVALFNACVLVSSLIMLWLLWHFPIATATTALVGLAVIVILARLAKTIDFSSPGHDAHDSQQS